jgi:hypothetical protein
MKINNQHTEEALYISKQNEISFKSYMKQLNTDAAAQVGAMMDINKLALLSPHFVNCYEVGGSGSACATLRHADPGPAYQTG